MGTNTKDTIFQILRAILSALGAFLIGRKIFGTDIDPTNWQTAVGGIMTLVAFGWGILDKSATIEMWQSGIRTLVTFIGGALLSKGILNTEQVATILSTALVVLPLIYGLLSKQKSSLIASGKLPVAELKQNEPTKK